MTGPIAFHHGLGDCANAARLIAAAAALGHPPPPVHCTPDKRPVFDAAGCPTADGGTPHAWPHPPGCGTRFDPQHPWRHNKVGGNIASFCDLPPDQVWRQMERARLTVATTEADDEVAAEIARRCGPGPLVLFHPQANTSPGAKSLTHDQQRRFVRRLISETDAAVLILDWDSRCWRTPHSRLHHLDDWGRRLSVPQLIALARRAAVTVGVDSGPLHLLAAAGDTPVVGVWHAHRPQHFAVPAAHVVHVVPEHEPHLTALRRPFRAIAAADTVDGALWAVRRLLEGATPAELVLEDALRRCDSQDGALSGIVDRHRTFAAVLDWIRRRHPPVRLAVETGTMRAPEDWPGAGGATWILGAALELYAAEDAVLISVDRDPRVTQAASVWADALPVTLRTADALEVLAELATRPPSIDLLYLDSLDTEDPRHAAHCLAELRTAWPALRRPALVVIDDTVWDETRLHWIGKGRLAVPWLLDRGARILGAGYQVVAAVG